MEKELVEELKELTKTMKEILQVLKSMKPAQESAQRSLGTIAMTLAHKK